MKDISKNDVNSPYGKFDSAEELLAAYNALEREFTKRCQSLKALRAASESRSAQAADLSDNSEPAVAADASALHDADAVEAVTAPDVATDGASEIGEGQSGATVNGCAPSHVTVAIVADFAKDHADELAAIPSVMDACIARYKQKLISGFSSGAAIRGAAVLTPVKRPRTLEEAKTLADEMLG